MTIRGPWRYVINFHSWEKFATTSEEDREMNTFGRHFFVELGMYVL